MARQKQDPKYYARYYRKHKKQICERISAWVRANPDKCRQYALKKNYGISIKEIRLMKLKQRNCCALCHKRFTKTRQPVLDHNHASLKNRALLHRGCNTRLGVVEDKKFMSQAKAYLRKYD